MKIIATPKYLLFSYDFSIPENIIAINPPKIKANKIKIPKNKIFYNQKNY